MLRSKIIDILSSKMPPYFELKLEIYSFLLNDTHTSTHAKLVKSISKAMGKTFVKTLREQENQVFNINSTVCYD